MTGAEFYQMYWNRSAGNTRRFHSEEWVGVPQTVGAHSWAVAQILLFVLGPTGLSMELLHAALCHDMAERFLGDVPAPAKWALNAGNYDKVENCILESMGVGDRGLTDLDRSYLKAADFLEACFAAFEQRLMGNRLLEQVFERLAARERKNHALLDCHPRFRELYSQLTVAYRGTDNTLVEIGCSYLWEHFQA